MFIQTNYDASACYDRIIPNLAMIVSHQIGVDKCVAQSNANTQRHAQYHIRKELGLSETSYSHSFDKPIYRRQDKAVAIHQWSGVSYRVYSMIATTIWGRKSTHKK